MVKMRESFAYVRLNFQRCIYQGKTAVILVCMLLFFQMYLGRVRPALTEEGLFLGLGELFLVMTNNIYTSFTIWAGFILLICDIPYRDGGMYQYLLRTSKSGWLLGQLLYLAGITCLYFGYIFVLLLLLTAPRLTPGWEWSDTIFKMIHSPQNYGIENWFSFPVSIMRVQTPGVLFRRCAVLCLLAGIMVGSLTMLLHLLWKNGPGIAAGGILLVWDYWATAIQYWQKNLLYLSPISLSRIGNISGSRLNGVNPGFGYACSLMIAVTVLAFTVMCLRIRSYEYS